MDTGDKIALGGFAGIGGLMGGLWANAGIISCSIPMGVVLGAMVFLGAVFSEMND